MEYGIYSLYSNLIDTKVKFCSLCFKIVNEDAVCIQDTVLLGSDENDVDCCKNEEVDMHCILQEILGNTTASNLSANDAICDQCTRSALSSYNFIRMCRNNSKSMATAVDVLTNTVSDLQTDFDDHQTLFLSMNSEGSECTQYLDTVKYVDNKTALNRFLCLCKPYRTITDSKGITKYQCTQCPLFYTQKSAARKHFNAKHVVDQDLKKELREIEVKVETPKRRSYKLDTDKYYVVCMIGSDGKTKHKCRKCPTEFIKPQSVIRHYQQVHIESPVLTSKGKSKLKTRENSKDYVKYLNKISHVAKKDIDGSITYQCTLCETVCTNAANARRHFQSRHMNEQKSVKSEFKNIPLSLPCSFCKENFNNKYVLIQHILQKHSIESVKDFTNIDIESDIYNHIYTKALDENGVEKCRCRVCSKLCKNYTILKVHFDKIHLKLPKTNASLYICSHCGKKCNNSYALKRHEEYHTLTLVCPTCNKKYKSRQCFKTHVCFKETARNDMKRDFICDACGKRFISKTSLRIHIKYRHEPESTRFPCQHCPKKFGTKSQWKNHQVTHTKEKNFACDLCGNVFVSQMSLVYHRRIHTGETPFQCKYCDMKFINTSRRADHVKRHHISALATCDICGVSVKAVGLKKHRKRHFDAKSTLCINRFGVGENRKAQESKKQLSYDSDS